MAKLFFEPSDTIALNPVTGVILAELQTYSEGSLNILNSGTKTTRTLNTIPQESNFQLYGRSLFDNSADKTTRSLAISLENNSTK